MSADPVFSNLAHSASTAVFTFQIEGPGIQPLSDESWAMDNLKVSVTSVPETDVPMLALTGMGIVLGLVRRRGRVS